ncbi:hypothetical protein BCCR75502_00697 [Burkholderia sola]|nr:hypothetical protein BCCR75389_00686 [Burkholderia cenocepacia]CAG2262450.1 hypothetical protein BCCR75386_00698 [Burkholderia cenocepacia]CAG2262557.1 hypothetical protein BCCR75388_00699 [Burkholderia cenocepacia]CAG2262629.1 hypothetical protein BCCR75387_00699 [Burkholderia cenocepacia]CAG2262637.1 hypothetical protein BCCR75384_00699 [Burkholderia cenocepacia]
MHVVDRRPLPVVNLHRREHRAIVGHRGAT